MFFSNKDNADSKHVKAGHSQLVSKMEAELKDIARKEAEANRRRDETNAAIQQMTNVKEARMTRLSDLRIREASIRQAYNAAYVYATRAQQTLGEQQAVIALKELKDTLDQAENELHHAEEHHAQSEAKEAARLAERHSEVQSADDELAALDKQRQEAEMVYKRELRALGETTYQEAVEALDAQSRKIQAERQSVVASQLTLEQMIETNISKMADWPDLQGKIRSHYLACHDEITTFLELGIALRAKLLDSSISLNETLVNPAIERQAGEQWPDLPTLLALDIQLIQQAMTGRHPAILVEQKAKQERLLAAYRTFKQSQV